MDLYLSIWQDLKVGVESFLIVIKGQADSDLAAGLEDASPSHDMVRAQVCVPAKVQPRVLDHAPHPAPAQYKRAARTYLWVWCRMAG